MDKDLIAKSGQSFWLDYIDRELINSGTLDKYIKNFEHSILIEFTMVFCIRIKKLKF